MKVVSPRARGLLLIAVAALFAGQELYAVLGGWVIVGIDFVPLRDAARALLDGTPVFADPHFVYPPTAAVALLPAAFGSATAAFVGWVLAGVAALLLAALLLARAAPRSQRLTVFGVAAMGLLGGVIAGRSLFLGNLSELLVPVAVGVLLAFHRGRWVLGCALLAATLLIKPLLAPLLLVPILHRRRRALATTMLPAGALLVLSVLLVPGGREFPHVLRYVVGGTDLHDRNAINNLSLRGWAEGQHAPHVLGVAAAVAVVLAVLWRVGRGGGSRLSPVWLGNGLLLGTFLAGGIAEVHFLLIAYAGILLFVVVHRLPARVWARFLPGLLLLAVPGSYLNLLLGQRSDGQTWLVAAEVLLFVALLATPVGGVRSGAWLRRRAVPVPA
ncbi:glycosyltransferase 87 family protein [Paractinoplanes durhamensis]|uniref:Membrane protein n=1 Tax=Paractinoplanes durhamensis TaxID=113563 RepID=A0ABQ3YWN1_9ACTN|nr:glycosyltransferase 87 family protein [Actinoplanes durhamensis]GIE01958.1 membrane protein [Actinoplanes durhamensis]